MLFYRELEKEHSGGAVGLNIFFGTLGMMAISKTSSIMHKNISKEFAYGVAGISVLFYLISYLLFIIFISFIFLISA